MEAAGQPLSPQLLENIRRNRGEAAAAWLRQLPGIQQQCLQRWSLRQPRPFADLSYNYVARVRRGDGTRAVLKICCPDPDDDFSFENEAEALRLFAGDTAVALLAVDFDLRAMLLEYAMPGNTLDTLEDDAAATSIVASIMRGLWRPAPKKPGFPHAAGWLRQALQPATLAVTKRGNPWLAPALVQAEEMAKSPEEQLLLHGDLHQGNILAATRRPWLAIDPHGVLGEAAWELAPFLFNNLPGDRAAWTKVIRRRVDQLAAELALDKQRVYGWSAVRAIQSLWWSFKDKRIASDAKPHALGVLAVAQELWRGP